MICTKCVYGIVLRKAQLGRASHLNGEFRNSDDFVKRIYHIPHQICSVLILNCGKNSIFKVQAIHAI